MPKVFIIILNWNQPDLTIECLQSVSKLKQESYEVHSIVVDNGSTDKSVKMLNAKCTKEKWKVTILESEINLGFAGGNNVGITYAMDHNADYVILLNNDTEIDPNLIEGLLKTFYEHPKAGAISPKIYFAKGYEFHKSTYAKK